MCEFKFRIGNTQKTLFLHFMSYIYLFRAKLNNCKFLVPFNQINTC